MSHVSLQRTAITVPYRPLFVILVMMVSLLLVACSPESANQEVTVDRGPGVPVSRDAATRFFKKVGAALENAPQTRQVTLSVTEEEVTSALNVTSEMAEMMQAVQTMDPRQLQDVETFEELQRAVQEANRNPEGNILTRSLSALNPRVTLQEPQVRFRNGRISVDGYVQVWRWQQPLRLVFAPQARVGELDLDFVAGQLGPISVPESIVDELGKWIAWVILAGQDYAEITRIDANNGTFSFNGRLP